MPCAITKTFAAAVFFTFALRIGAAIGIFSVIYGVLVVPLPFADPDHIVQISEHVPEGTRALHGTKWVGNPSLYAWEPTPPPWVPVHTSAPAWECWTPQATSGGARAGRPELLRMCWALYPFVAGLFTRTTRSLAPTVWWSRAVTGGAIPSALTHIVGRIVIHEQDHGIIGVAPPGVRLPTSDTPLWTRTRLAALMRPGGQGVHYRMTYRRSHWSSGVACGASLRIRCSSCRC